MNIGFRLWHKVPQYFSPCSIGLSHPRGTLVVWELKSRGADPQTAVGCRIATEPGSCRPRLPRPRRRYRICGNRSAPSPGQSPRPRRPGGG